MSDETIKEYLKGHVQKKSKIKFDYIIDKKVPVFESESVDPLFTGIDNLSSSGTSGSVEPWNVFKLSDGRYISLFQNRDNRFVTIRDKDFSNEVVCISSSPFNVTANNFVYQSGDDFYFQLNDRFKLIKLSKSNGYSSFIENNLNYNFNGYTGFSIDSTYFIYGIVKFDNKHIVILTATDTGNFPNNKSYIIFCETTDFINLKMINKVETAELSINLYYMQFGSKVQLYWFKSSSGAGTIEYDMSKNEIYNVEWNVLEPIFNMFNTGKFYSKRLFYYDDKTDFLYYGYPSDNKLYKRKRNEPLANEKLLGTIEHKIEWLVKEKVSTGLQLIVMQQSYVYEQETNTSAYGIGFQKFNSRYTFQYNENTLDLANNKTQVNISVGSKNPNPVLNADFYATNRNERKYYLPFGQELIDLVITSDRKIRVSAAYANGGSKVIFTGRTDSKHYSTWDNPVQLESYGNFDMLEKDVTQEYTLTADTLENTIKNIVLRNPLIKESDLEFDVIGLNFPQMKYEKGKLVQHVDKVLNHFPEIDFYYDLDGKFKLKKRKRTGESIDFYSDSIIEIELNETKKYNCVKVESNGLFGSSIFVMAKDPDKIEFANGIERVFEFITSAYKTEADLNTLAKRLLDIVSHGIVSMTFTVVGLHPVDLNEIISIQHLPYNLTGSYEWVVKQKEYNLDDENQLTKITVESLIM